MSDIIHAALAAVLKDELPQSPQLASVAKLFTARRLKKNQTLLREGAVWTQAVLIERGILRMHFTRRDGKEFNKNFHAEGALICPISAAMIDAPSLFSISAIESAVVWLASAVELRRSLQGLNAWEPLRVRLLEGLVTSKLQREHDLLALDARSRYERFCAAQPELAARIPLAHLATYLGITDVSLSRIRRQMRND